MLITTFSFIIAIIIPPIVLLAAFLLSARSMKDREKSSPFECGFDPKSKARIPFSTRFFLLAVIFLVFDIEIVLLMPAPMAALLNSSWSFILATMTFLLILIIGLLHEWNEGSLNWAP